MLALFLTSAVFLVQEPEPQAEASTASTFGQSETHVLENGLRVWLQHLPGDPNVGLSLTLPHGFDADPPGRDQLAHFVEHMLFKAHMGRSELEVSREISERGGTENGVTYDDHSAYWVHLPREHTAFAIEWLWKILSPHAMEPATVAAEREPIALEIGARKRELADHFRAWFWNPPFLRQPGFWEREFGITAGARRDYDAWRSLHAIQPADLEEFYARYYVPGRMTLSVSGDLDPAFVLEEVRRTFGTLAGGPEPPATYQVQDPGRPYRAFRWGRRASVWYRAVYKLFEPSAEDLLTAMFTSRFLGERLTDMLRRGDDKAVYGLSVGNDQHGPAVGFQIQANIRADLYATTLETIEGELEALRLGTHDPALFASVRDSIAGKLQSGMTEAADFVELRNDVFYDAELFQDLPDLLGSTQGMTQARVAAFARRTFVDERLVLDVTAPEPIPRVGHWAINLALLGLTYLVARWLLVRAVEMRNLRYVARLRVSPLYALLAGGLGVALLAILGRLGVWLWMLARARWVLPVDSYGLQLGVRCAGLVLSTVLVIWILSYVPRKLLVFSDELLVKGLLFRSRKLRPEDIAAVELLRFHEVWLSARLWRCVPLTLGLLRPQLYLETVSGRSYYFRVRDRDELRELLEEF